MKKIIKKYFIIVLLFQSTVLYSQIEIKIKEIKLSYFNSPLKKFTYDEDKTQGPYVFLTCLMKNNSNKSLQINPSKSYLYLVYNYENITYNKELVAMPFSDIETIHLKQNDSVEFNVGDNILLGTPIFKEKKYDYTLEMLTILPTVRVEFVDPIQKIICFSDQICKVSLISDKSL